MKGGEIAKVGMDSVWTALTSTGNLNAESLSQQLGYAVPFIAMAALFAFGFWIMRRAVKRASHGKAGI